MKTEDFLNVLAPGRWKSCEQQIKTKESIPSFMLDNTTGEKMLCLAVPGWVLQSILDGMKAYGKEYGVDTVYDLLMNETFHAEENQRETEELFDRPEIREATEELKMLTKIGGGMDFSSSSNFQCLLFSLQEIDRLGGMVESFDYHHTLVFGEPEVCVLMPYSFFKKCAEIMRILKETEGHDFETQGLDWEISAASSAIDIVASLYDPDRKEPFVNP